MAWFRSLWVTFFGYVNELFEEHKLARRSVLYWALAVVTFTVVMFFRNIDKVGAAQATVITGIIGLVSTCIVFYQWSRDKEK